MNLDPVKEYRRRYDSFLKTVAEQLEKHVKDAVAGIHHIDRVGARAKAPDRFEEKIVRPTSDGKQKYQKPLTEMQDLIGARIIVFYRNDVEIVTKQINRYFRHIEQKEMVPDELWSFGYFGEHLILAMPRDVIPKDVDVAEVPSFFELQIKTLFQHAWSESNHDLGYKAPKKLTDDQVRRFAYTAAQAWGADRVFEELRAELQH